MVHNSNHNSHEHNVLLQEFLDFKINECLPKFRENHKEEYGVIIKVIQLFNSLKEKFVGKNASEQDIFLLSYIIELNKLFQSAVLLFERGIPSSANIIIRTILELSLNIVETINNEEYLQAILLDEIEETRSTVNIAKEFKRNDLIPPERIQEIQAAYDLLSQNISIKKMSPKKLAQKNGFEIEYLLYRIYCSDTHKTASALAKNFNASSSGIIFDAGIRLDDFKYDLRRLISIAIIPVPSLINDYFNDEDLNNQYNSICKNFESVFK